MASIPATRQDLASTFGVERPLVGMVHLLPLPGSPRWGGSMEQVLDRARADARALVEGGMDGLLVENLGDAPYHPGPVPSETVAALALALQAVRTEAAGRPVGVNVLRNDARAGVGLAATEGADFLRVNVHAGTMFTDQGTLQGSAHDTLRARARLAPNLLLLADVLVKHARPPAGIDPGTAALDLRERGLADVLVVSGARTGAPTDPVRIQAVRRAVPDAPIWVGSGLTRENARELLAEADGAIVGSALHRDGLVGRGIELSRVRELMDEVRG
jgi:uncharacterized protein